MAIRMLKVAKNISDTTIPAIDSTNVLGLKSPYDRCDLFVLAMALGIESGKKGEMNNKGIALVRESSVSSKNNAYITSLLISELQTSGELDKIADKDEAYSLAQDYANSGFKIISDLIKCIQQGDTQEDTIWNMISDLDSKYDELFPDEN